MVESESIMADPKYVMLGLVREKRGITPAELGQKDAPTTVRSIKKVDTDCAAVKYPCQISGELAVGLSAKGVSAQQAVQACVGKAMSAITAGYLLPYTNTKGEVTPPQARIDARGVISFTPGGIKSLAKALKGLHPDLAPPKSKRKSTAAAKAEGKAEADNDWTQVMQKAGISDEKIAEMRKSLAK